MVVFDETLVSSTNLDTIWPRIAFDGLRSLVLYTVFDHSSPSRESLADSCSSRGLPPLYRPVELVSGVTGS